VKYAFIDTQRGYYSLKLMCRVLSVSRSGYYHWKSRSESNRYKFRQVISALVIRCYRKHRKRYGAPRIAEELTDYDIPCSTNHAAVLLQEAGLKAKNGIGFKYTKPGESTKNVCTNLILRNFKALGPDQKWVTDITYIRVMSQWMYLATVMDLYSRFIVGWSIDTQMTELLACNAFQMAIGRRNVTRQMIIHSDQGVQYRSKVYQDMLRDHGCQISMSRKGNCWDNAAMESFFSRLKVELIYGEKFYNFDHVRQEVFEYIEIYYNRQRKHSALGYKSPLQFERLDL